MKYLEKLVRIFGVLFISAIQPSCKKLITIPPQINGISSANVYSTNTSAAAVLTGIYTGMSQGNQGNAPFGLASFYLYGGLSADEVTLYDINNVAFLPYYLNNLSSTNTGGTDFWLSIYPVIYTCNAAIEGLNDNTSVTSAVQKQLIGESLFVRAFCYFYLVNLYGNVPLVLSTDYKNNALLSRNTVSQVYNQIIVDLVNARSLLSANYLEADAQTPYATSSAERIRPTKWAAESLLARTYLYYGNYADAVLNADSVINNSTYFNLDSLNAVSGTFLKNSTETIWALQPTFTYPSSNTGEGAIFVLPSAGPNTSGSFPVYLDSNLVKSFERGDQRRVHWIDSVIVQNVTYYFPFKYQQGVNTSSTTEYSIIFRLSEQYLIRAEAEARGAGGGLANAIADLNVIRSRAWLPPLSSSLTQTQILDTILHERRVELFTEWGHRWLDLKRTNMLDSIMQYQGAYASKGGMQWNNDWQWYPIQLTELQADPNLVQNIGY